MDFEKYEIFQVSMTKTVMCFSGNLGNIFVTSETEFHSAVDSVKCIQTNKQIVTPVFWTFVLH